MDLESIAIFIDVQSAGSFAEVARQRRVAPSSISRIVAQLEDSIGAQLFHRSTRRLHLTEAGSRFLARVTPILNELQFAVDEARSFTQEPKGLIRIAAAHTFANTQVVKWLPKFCEIYPKD